MVDTRSGQEMLTKNNSLGLLMKFNREEEEEEEEEDLLKKSPKNPRNLMRKNSGDGKVVPINFSYMLTKLLSIV